MSSAKLRILEKIASIDAPMSPRRWSDYPDMAASGIAGGTIGGVLGLIPGAFLADAYRRRHGIIDTFGKKGLLFGVPSAIGALALGGSAAVHEGERLQRDRDRDLAWRLLNNSFMNISNNQNGMSALLESNRGSGDIFRSTVFKGNEPLESQYNYDVGKMAAAKLSTMNKEIPAESVPEVPKPEKKKPHKATGTENIVRGALQIAMHSL